MSVTQKSDGRWCVVQYVDGKQRWKYFGRGAEAEKAAREYDSGLKDSGRVREYKKRSKSFGPTLTELAEAYLKSKAATLPAVSIKNTRYKLEAVILPLIGHYKAMKLTADILDRYVAKRSQDVKMTTIHRELSDVQAIMNWSVKRRLLPHNPVHGFQKPKRDDEIIKPPSQHEIKAIFDHAPAHLKRALTISYYTGLRPGNAELFKLTWKDVDLNDETFHIVSAKKNGIRERWVPLHASFKKLLNTWHKADGGEGFLVYYGKKRRPIKSIKTAWRSVKEKAKITRRLRPYDLRHAFASAMLAAGGDLKATSELLGHSRPDTTMRVYQHTNPALVPKNWTV